MADPNEYPRMMYHPDGRTEVVDSNEREGSLGEEWSREPNDVHRRGVARTPGVAREVPRAEQEHLIETIANRVIEKLDARNKPDKPDKSTDTSAPARRRSYTIEGEPTNG